MKNIDEDMINEALGLSVKKKHTTEVLTSFDLKELLSRGNTTRDSTSAERVSGLGAEPVRVHEHIDRIYQNGEIAQIFRVRVEIPYRLDFHMKRLVQIHLACTNIRLSCIHETVCK